MELLKKQRAIVRGCITRLETFVLNNENNLNVDVNEYVTTDMYLQQKFEEYCQLQVKLEELDGDEAEDREGLEMKYLTIWSKIKAQIKTRNDLTNSNLRSNLQQPPTQTGHSGRARLPNINTPSFSGNIEEWQTFFDLFTAIIDNNSSLDNVQKFIYLKGALSGEALNLINDLPLTNDNYMNALDLLKKRYDNKLIVINAHLKGMLDTPLITRFW